VLIGYRGSGKTIIGRALAKRLGFSFVDTDAVVERDAKMKIPEIFSKLGEPRFRDLEAAAVAEACAKGNSVIATGGGAPMREESAGAMKKSGVVVFLECSPETIHSRIEGDSRRPALTDLGGGLQEIRLMLQKRDPTYRALADFVEDTGNKTVMQNVEGIIVFLRGRGLLGELR